VSQGGLKRDAEQLIPEQFTVTGPCRRDAEPSLRSSEQFPFTAASPEEQLATETDTEEENSGTYNLKNKTIPFNIPTSYIKREVKEIKLVDISVQTLIT